MGTGVGTEDSAGPQELVSDSELTKKVEKALKKEAQLQNLDINVKVNNGVVTLSGDAKDVRFQGRQQHQGRQVSTKQSHHQR